MRNVKPLWSRLGTMAGVMLGGIDMWLNTVFPFLPHTLKHLKPDYAGLSKASDAQPIEYEKPTASSLSTFSPRSSCRAPITKRTSRCISG